MALTQAQLKRVLRYDPDTGEFTRLVTVMGHLAGSKVGSVQGAGYVKVTIEGQRYAAHRLAWLYMTGKWPEEVDHINRVRTDNRWCNLRDVPHRMNSLNRPINRNNRSGVRGVWWHESRKRWVAVANVQNGTQKMIGRYSSFNEAVLAREQVMAQLQGELSSL
jgi:HNH endonuclease/AP2 domain